MTDKTTIPEGDDIAVWPDDVWCHLREVESFLQWKSDDYEVVKMDDSRYDQIVNG